MLYYILDFDLIHLLLVKVFTGFFFVNAHGVNNEDLINFPIKLPTHELYCYKLW